MHQHPRPAPVTASPANSPRTNPAKTNNPRDRDPESNAPQAEAGANNVSGLGIEGGTETLEQAQPNTVPAKEGVTKLNQIIQVSRSVALLLKLSSQIFEGMITNFMILGQNYHTKAALIILHSRVDLPAVYSRGSDVKRVNRWVGSPKFARRRN
jgi:autophagy-related protein 13